MFEAHVLHLLRRYLGEYVHGLSTEALRISVWKGDVVLKDLKLKAEALNSLKLPVTVKAGFVGTITLKVPWKSLGKEPVIVLIDRVFLLAFPAPDGRTLKEEDREKLLEAKLQQIEEAESATLDSIAKSKLGSPPPGNSWLGSLIATIIGNLKISISNVHIRYEDSVSNPGHPFAAGITLAKLAAVTMDEEGNETFDTSGALDKLRKSLQLQRLALYHDFNSLPWEIKKKWEDLCPEEWVEIFEDGIKEQASDGGMLSKRALNRQYILSPINGVLKYHRLGNQERNNPEIPFERASLVLTDVNLTITEEQYHDWIKLFEVVSRYKTYIEVSHLRPVVSVSEAPYLWWRYAAQAGLQQKKMCYRFSWDRVHHLCQLRRRYVQFFANSLQQSSNVNCPEIREIEKDLDPKVILLWRLLAHAKVESVKSKEAAEQRRLKKGGWFSFRWRTGTEDETGADGVAEGSQLMEEGLTKEEWEAVNKLLSHQPDEEMVLYSGKKLQNMVHFLITVSIGQGAARIIDVNQTEMLCGRFEQLDVTTKFKYRSTQCDVSLRFYGLSAPEGSLAQSVSSERKTSALVASFVNSPVGENIDWRLSATISPCHATIWTESWDRVLEFVKRSNAVSPTIALETATALQMKLEKVTRRAQEQFQVVLEEQSRFALDIDLDAPKVRIPLRVSGSSKCDSHFVLDFGSFTLTTMDGRSDEQRQTLYSRFYISGRDIAAFFMDCGSENHGCSLLMADFNNQPILSPIVRKADSVYSLIDRCGMAVIVDQIKVPHPSYPSTRVSIQVPNLGIHFSPTRYLRIMELVNILYGAMKTCGQPPVDTFPDGMRSWNPADLVNDARILVWRGIGNSVATWQPCYLVLSGLYLYAFESERSLDYQRWLSMAGRQVFEVPPANVGGSPFCIAVGLRGMDLQKALESSSTWILEFQGLEEKTTWLRGLIQATYQASAPLSVNVLGQASDDVTEFHEPQTTVMKAADLVINGALVETKLHIYGKARDGVDEKHGEVPLLEVLAAGGKVHLLSSESGLTVRTKLHSLKIKDELQQQLSGMTQYLAYSVLKNENIHDLRGSFGSNDLETSIGHLDDEDAFTDALPEFSSPIDPGTPDMDMIQCSMMMDSDEHVGFKSAELVHEKDASQGKGFCDEIFYEVQGAEFSDFISVVFLTRSSGAHDYNGIDTQMSIRMSKLEFFCNRPTVVALIGFGFDMSAVTCLGNDKNVNAITDEKSLTEKEKNDESLRVEGLLGYGKDRVVFYLNMNVDSVTVFLNKEDGSQLAMLVQERFLLDIKVHPSSLAIEGTLGNFKLCDKSLGRGNCWSWLCDLRDPGVESLIKFKFNSYSSGDDDYEGYDYSLSGRLSAVRIVFLYRFVQEVMAYFMGLATPHTEEVIKLVDKVGGFEWLIQKYEMDGATALKLDLSLDTPIIVVPRDSISKDYIQLDLGQLEVSNEISWHGCPEKDPSAVRVDVLHAKILGLNMSVGIDGCIGKPMIREGQGLDIFVRRSLRDVFRKVPTFSLEVKIDFLHAVMSDKEYDIIVNCTYMNLCEEPKLPPNFRGSNSCPDDKMRLLVDKVNFNGQTIMSRTVTILAVDINYAVLELRNSANEESPLADVALEGLWVSYRMTSLSETDLYVSVPKFSVLDIRPNTKPEMRLMLGSSVDSCKHYAGSFPFSLNKGSFKRVNSRAVLDTDAPSSTMLLMDYRWRASSQSFVVRVQQPRILAVPDFLLAVGEFFVPALRAMTGRDETMDPKNDPITKNSSIVLSVPLYKQSEDVVSLSPCRQLVADSLGVDEYIYDGCGKVIFLSEQRDKDFNTFEPIIIIGQGKKLRFVNVKIKNGSLLSKCVYLSNDSSYSLSPEDGVDISMVENSSSDPDDVFDNAYASSDASDTSSLDDSKPAPSFTFEAQVVSPEFTFFDGTKSSMDDSSFGEKLLRVKMDFSFMYASKENDIWVRALLKDLMVETGSGLIILDPVDISGGYTSVKEKTNMSLISTDIYVHLSLSALSLLLNLQSQVTGALQSGNAVPLTPCTNFDRIWISPKENGPSNNLTIWRPQAPSNYVILGDCVTSRSIPPTQAVMAVSNTYGRVRKPIGFNRIILFSIIHGMEGANDCSGGDNDCSLWMPIAPAGYTAMGCVANLGAEPPADHIVYCLRSDLVSSSSFSECMYSLPANSSLESGFSIWRVDNVLGSFYAHSSTHSPAKEHSCDLSHCLLWNPLPSNSSVSVSDPSAVGRIGKQQTSSHSVSSSGWDIVRSISRATNCFVSTPNFERIWWDKGGDLRRPVSIWRPIPRPGFAILGDCITEGLEPPALGILFKTDDPELAAKPVQFTKVAHVVGKSFDELFCWYPVVPPGYVSLGCVVSKLDETPRVDSFCCPRIDLVNQANVHEATTSRSSSSKSSHCWSIWKVENQACTFLVRSDLKKPSSRLAFAIGESVKPKTRENVNAEVKLRCFSLTLLDGLHGMMTPLFDTTVTNIKLATHGCPEAMNAVLISSIAASTFNPHLEAWEPLVEPFDGIFKLETYEAGLSPPSKLGKRVRVATTNILNINVSAANLETLGDAIVSWRRQLEIEQKAAKIKEEAGTYHGSGDFSASSALDEDDFQTIIVENKLGLDIYLKKLEENSDGVVKLCNGDSTSVWVPPPRFLDRLNVADGSREARHYMTIQILEAKGLHIVDDGNSHNFFCALRLVVDSQGADSQKLFPQSARTKCIKPSTIAVNHLKECSAKWNELFIFEIPRKGLARLEVEVTNLAAKAGKGEVVGSLSFPVGHGANTLRKVASVRMLPQPNNAQNISSYPLRKKSAEDIYDNGCLLVSTSYFEKTNTQRSTESKDFVDRDTGFWIGVCPRPDDSWQSIRSLLPLSVVPKLLQSDFIAMDVSMQNGKKHARFRGLAAVANESDINLEISLSFDQNGNLGPSNHKALIVPKSSYVLPWGCLSKDKEQCLHVRPGVENPYPSYAWGYCVAVSSGCGKDQPFVDQGLLTRQNILKQGSKPSTFALKLNQLEKKDMLFWCQPCTWSKPIWLSIGIDASVLHTDLNAPVYDWKIAINSPLKLENRLPCSANFTVWEKTKEGTYLERQHGTISSRKRAHIYSSDIQRPVYLTLVVDGGWAPEKDPIPVLDLSSSDNVSSFWLVHQQSKRRLRVSIERDMGETGAAPKTIRFFVPYWITNDSYLPLAYRVVEIEHSENMEADSPSLSRASKSFKKCSMYSMERRQQRKNVQVLEAIEDISPVPSMLSPQESAGRSGVMLFPGQKDSYLSPRIGVAVAVRHSEIYSPGISLLELEKKERIDVKAFCFDASYYKLSAVLNMTSDRTKVIHLQPHTLFINRVGLSVCLQQCDTQTEEWIHPSDPPKLFRWQSSSRVELLKLRASGYRWSTPFSVCSEGLMRVTVGKEYRNDQFQLRVEVRSGTKNSRYEVIFRPNSVSSPYRIENRSMFLPICCRQVDGSSDSWQFLPPNTTTSFYWEDLGRRHLLELLVDGTDPSKSEKYDIDEIGDHPPRNTVHGPAKAIRVTILKEDRRNIVRVSDWMPAFEPTTNMGRRLSASLFQLSRNQSQQAQLLAQEESEFHVTVELSELGISVIDHAPEEILYMSMQNLFIAYSTGLGSGLSRFKLRMQGIQVDNQLPLAPMPVLFRPQRTGDKADYILKFSVTLQSNASLDLFVYPYIGFRGTENTTFLINIHEPIIWRIHEMIQQANLSRLYDSQSTAVSVDPFIQIGVLNISEVRFKVSMAMSPSQRPRGVLGFWSSLMTALGNTENMPVRISERFHENVSMRQSTMISNAISNIKKDLLGQPLQLLSGVDILGNASSALGHMSKGVAALSMDKKFIQSRQRQESKGVEDFGGIIREGGGALAKGLFRGVTGILTKPLEGAKSSGVEGFVSGVGKGIIGAAAQPVSGVLDLLSKTTEGANAMRMKLAAAITSDEQLLRRRLPRVIGADNLLLPYNEYRAQGQVILQLAESGSFLGQVDLFKVRGKFALTDAYENHFILPKGKILMMTHRRVILLQQPSNVIGQRKFIPAKDACSIMWDVLWDDLVTMECIYGKKDHPKSPPSRILLYLKSKPYDTKEQVRVVKCTTNTNQAVDVYSSIERAMNTYGRSASKEMVKNKVRRPYCPIYESSSGEEISKEGSHIWSPQQVPASVAPTSTFGGSSSPS